MSIGMIFSEFATWSIIVVAATVLHQGGITNIDSAADAAKTLEPLVQTFPYAGFLSKLIFAACIIGLGLLGIPGYVGIRNCDVLHFSPRIMCNSFSPSLSTKICE